MRSLYISALAAATVLGAATFAGGRGHGAPPAEAVAVKDEPHHHLLLENDYVRVYRFELAPHSATLLHLHALPYFGFALGAADYVNAVEGKPEAHATLEDAQISYSKGGFAHVVRTETDTRFYNFTVELLKPQANPRNRCVKVLPDGPLDCPVEAAGKPAAGMPAFETDEVLVQVGGLPAGPSFRLDAAPTPRLVLILEDSQVSIEERGGKPRKLHGGEAYWFPSGASGEIVNMAKETTKGKGKDKVTEEPKFARFYMLVFK
jgi:hypothetical protein